MYLFVNLTYVIYSSFICKIYNSSKYHIILWLSALTLYILIYKATVKHVNSSKYLFSATSKIKSLPMSKFLLYSEKIIHFY